MSDESAESTESESPERSQRAEDDSLVERFRQALLVLEDSSSTDELVALYAPECELGNVVHGESFDGRDGAGGFWSTYRAQFDDVSSEFGVVVGTDDGAVLEWTTVGTVNGNEITYRGATVLEFEGDRIIRSMAYYDPAGLGDQILPSD